MQKRRYLYLWFILVVTFIAYGVVYYYNELRFKGEVCLISLGETNPKQVALIKKEIEQFYGFSVKILPVEDLPEAAYYQPRNRYKATLLLKYLADIKPADEDKIIALVQKDISIKTDKREDSGIIGLAKLGGCCCVVSTFRLVSDKPTQKKFNERLTKVSLHEVGHTLGLDHCNQSVYCLMNDAKGLVKTIDKERMELCEQCRKRINYTKRKL